ncbi:M23 family metallopeptidase [Altererythrobacter sp. SALINAS58]|nr:M23 family metallopeptidase [Alteripontixanthobacter muriae]
MHPILGTWSQHHGIDLAAASGTPVTATAAGTISRAEWAGNYGLLVEIDHGGYMETRYAHLSVLGAVKGRRVKKGDVIGFVGSTGRSTGPHLHYEVRIANTPVDPTPFLSSPDAEGHARGLQSSSE